MRILFYSVAPWFGTGYGVTMRNVAPRLMAAGHEVVVATTAGLQDARVVWNGIPVWPMMIGPTAINIGHVAEFQPDVVITLFDQWVLETMQGLGSLYLPWTVVHYDPMEPLLYRGVQHTWRQWAFCQWGAEMMRAKGLHPRVVSLGVDTSAYRPLAGELDSKGEIITKARCKAAFGMPEDAFCVGMVAANIDFRKGIERQLRVFAKFQQKYPDARLFIKTNPTTSEGGLDLERAARAIFELSPERPEAPILYPERDAALSTEAMCQLYNSFDVYLNCAYAEGFGMTIVEAGACGVPQIVTDCSAMSEVGYGWKIPGTRELNVLYSFGIAADEDAMFAALEQAYQERGTQTARIRSQAARAHALEYDWDKVVSEQMLPELESWYLDREL